VDGDGQARLRIPLNPIKFRLGNVELPKYPNNPSYHAPNALRAFGWYVYFGQFELAQCSWPFE